MREEKCTQQRKLIVWDEKRLPVGRSVGVGVGKERTLLEIKLNKGKLLLLYNLSFWYVQKPYSEFVKFVYEW